MKHDDAGFSLLETLIAIALLAVAIVVIAGGMSVSVLASSRHREQAAAHALLLQAAENVKSSSVAHIRCADPTSWGPYEAAAQGVLNLPTGWSATDIRVAQIRYYDGTGFGTTCNDRPTDLYPLTLQLITLEVRSPAGRTLERLSLVKGGP